MQVVEISKFVLVMWHFSILIVVPVFSDVDSFCKDKCSGCMYNVTEDGSLSLEFEDECNDDYCVVLNFTRETSIIELTASFEHFPDVSNLTEIALLSATKEIRIDISEFDDREYILLETRYLHINETNTRSETSYLTRTSKSLICVSDPRKCSNCSMNLFFKEIEYRRLKTEINPLNVSGEIVGHYRPNSVSLYKLPKDPERKWKGINITIQDLEIDTEMGEYLIIGAGSSEDFPPRFITESSKYFSFYVGNESAYIEIVSGPIFKTDKSFEIVWNRVGAEAEKKTPFEELNSALICFYDYAAANKEFEKKDKDEVFQEFRKAFSNFAKNYSKFAMKRKVDHIDETSVKLIGNPTVLNESNAIAVLITVIYERQSTFSWRELQTITEEFEKVDKNKTLGYKVGMCPSLYNDVPYKERWSIFIYASVPIFALFFLLIWAWQNNIFAQKCIPEKEEKLSFHPDPCNVTVEPNLYETTVPKVYVHSADGRRETLIQGSSQTDTERRNVNDVTTVELNDIPSTSRRSETLTRFLNGNKCKKRPSIQSLISKNKGSKTTEQSQAEKTEGSESDHLYDSVSSTKQMDETKL